MKNSKKRVIIFTEGIVTGSEKSRDWKINFEPQIGDFVKLQNYELFQPYKDIVTEKDAVYKVIGRTVTEEVLYVHLEKV